MDKEQVLDVVVKYTLACFSHPVGGAAQLCRQAAAHYIFGEGALPWSQDLTKWQAKLDRQLAQIIDDLTQPGGKLAGLKFDRSRLEKAATTRPRQTTYAPPQNLGYKPKQRGRRR